MLVSLLKKSHVKGIICRRYFELQTSMHTYEITYLVETEEQSKVVRGLITSTGATYKEVKDWGERELAYPIQKHSKARYYTGLVDTIPTNVTEIKKKLNFSDAVIRYLIVKQEE